MQDKDRRKHLFTFIVAIIILLFTIYYSLIAKHSDLSFDGAIYNQGIVSYLKYGTYVNYLYDKEDLTKARFSLFTQGMLSQYFLNIPFVMIWGLNNFSLQANNIIFLILSSILLYYLVVCMTGNYYTGLLSVILFFTFPGMKHYGLAGFGEIPAFFYILLIIFLLHKSLISNKYFSLLGFSLFLAIHTKLFLILLFPILLFILPYLWLYDKKMSFRSIMAFGSSFILPILMLHFIIWFKFGWNEVIEEYRSFLILSAISEKSLGTSLLGRIFYGMKAITQEYGSLAHFYGPLMIGSLAAIFCIGINIRLSKSNDNKFKRFFYLDRTQIIILFLLLTLFVYIVLYFHISDSHQTYRRILPILLLTIPFYCISIGYAINKWGQKRRFLISVVCLLLFVSMLYNQISYFISSFELKTRQDQSLRDRSEIVDLIKKIPSDTKIFGVGWWQAPRLSLFSDRIFLDIGKNGVRKHVYDNGYLVFDREALMIAPETVRNTLDTYNTEVVKINGSYQLYRWNKKSGQNNNLPLILMQVGPDRTKVSKGFNIQQGWRSAMWAITANTSKTTVIVWDGVKLETTFGGPDNLTAYVPSNLYARRGKSEIYLWDWSDDRKSNSLYFTVED